MRVLKPYHLLFDRNNHMVMIKSGRDAGKSKAKAQKVTHNLFQYNLDILVSRANYGDLEKSMYSEILAVIEEEKLLPFIEQKKRPLKIINKLNGNIIYFEGIGGADLSRTKGFKPHKELSLIIVDEAQQLPSQNNLDQALATFRRHLNKDEWQIILSFNPERQNQHWCNEYFRMNEGIDEWLCIHTSWLDIADVLTEVDKRHILLEKKTNPSNYRYLYLGETEGLFGGVYYTFNRDAHLIKYKDVKKLIQKHGIFSVLIGVDSAKTRDKTALIPTLILGNGQGIVVEYFYHDPEKYGAISNDMLYPYIERWLDFLHNRYNISLNQRIDIIFDTDANSKDLQLVMANRLPKRYYLQSYSGKKVIELAHIMQNAFGRNVLYILDESIFNYYLNRYEFNFNPLVTQLESVIWDEKGKGFDDTVPNDCTDALTYSVGFYFKNPNAIYFPKREDYYERSDFD